MNNTIHHGALRAAALCITAVAIIAAVSSPSRAETDAIETFNVQVVKTGSGSGTVSTYTTDINCGATCTANFADGLPIVLMATPAAGSRFTGWTGPCSGRNNCRFVVDDNQITIVTATFATNVFASRFDIDGSFGPGDGLTDGLLILRHLFGLTGSALSNNAMATNATRTPVAIETYLNDIHPVLDIDANNHPDALSDGLMIIRYMFGLRGPELTVNAIGTGALRNTDAAIQAEIAARMPTLIANQLQVVKTGFGDGTVTSITAMGIDCGLDCVEQYFNPTTVTVAASTDLFSNIDLATANCDSHTVGTCTFNLTNDRLSIMTFTPITYNVNVSKAGAGTGTVTSSPTAINCGATCVAALPGNSTVILTATKTGASTFTGWSGACTGTSPTCTVFVNNTKFATATFAP